MFKTDDWVTDLPKLLENYNSRYCQPLGMAPNDATEETSRESNMKQFREAQAKFDEFAIGERVRKLIHKSSTFAKGKKRWSKEIYTIDNIRNHEFLLGDTWVKSWEVQKVPDNSPIGFDVFDHRVDETVVRKTKKVARDIKKEGIDTSNVIASKVEYIRVKEGGKFYIGKVVRQLRNKKWVIEFGGNEPDGEYTTEQVKEHQWKGARGSAPPGTRSPL
jgi:hypothetical protein